MSQNKTRVNQIKKQLIYLPTFPPIKSVSPEGLSAQMVTAGQRKRKQRMLRWVTYMSLIVHLVVGEFDSIKADDLTHPCLSSARRVRVHVEPGRDAGVIRVSSHHPLRAVVHIPAGCVHVEVNKPIGR